MCLTTVTRNLKRRSKKVYTVWKIFVTADDSPGYEFENCTLDGSWAIPCGKWVKADETYSLRALDNSVYQSGFHCYVDKASAIEHKAKRCFLGVVVECKARGLTCKGTQSSGETWVFSELFVPKKGGKK